MLITQTNNALIVTQLAPLVTTMEQINACLVHLIFYYKSALALLLALMDIINQEVVALNAMLIVILVLHPQPPAPVALIYS